MSTAIHPKSFDCTIDLDTLSYKDLCYHLLFTVSKLSTVRQGRWTRNDLCNSVSVSYVYSVKFEIMPYS